MLKSLFKAIAPLAAIGLAASLGGCDGTNIKINGEEGVPLAELDMSGEAPSEIIVAGPDKVIISDGETLDIQVEGDQDAVDALRFSLKDGKLAIMREGKNWSGSSSATVRVVTPTPAKLVVAGSGRIEAESLNGNAEIAIGGSGNVAVATITAETLDISIGGSGNVSGSGTADRLEIAIGGSGSVEMEGLKAGDAEIAIGGAGDARFASDGTVEASIAGSGDVTVIGRAKCEVSSIGSGKLNCEAPAGDGPEETTPDSDT